MVSHSTKRRWRTPAGSCCVRTGRLHPLPHLFVHLEKLAHTSVNAHALPLVQIRLCIAARNALVMARPEYQQRHDNNKKKAKSKHRTRRFSGTAGVE